MLLKNEISHVCAFTFSSGIRSSKRQTNEHFRSYTHECLFQKLLYWRVFTLNCISHEKSFQIKQNRFLSAPSHSLLFDFDLVLSPASFVWFVSFFFSVFLVRWSIVVRALQAPSFRTEQGYCEDQFLPLRWGKKTPLQVQVRLRDDPHWFMVF